MVCQCDENIIHRLTVNNTEGIHLLFDRYYSSLVLYADRFLHDRHTSEDVVQEFFVRLWEDGYLRKVPASGLSSYLFISVKNACLTFQTRKDVLRHSRELSGVEVPVEVFMSVEDERINRVMQEIEHLPLRSRQVLECVMLRGLKYKEAAAEMAISVNTVKFLLKEAIKRLRQSMDTGISQILFLFLQRIFRNNRLK